ncbi:MAG: OmpA family protein [Deltaproteobacteria bacterium]|nr:OmpA family protein [Deltaproteobacteria bacterium]
MNRHKAIQIIVAAAILLGWGIWDEVQAQSRRPTAEQIKQQLLPRPTVTPPAPGDMKTMGMRGVRPLEGRPETAAAPREVNLDVPFELNSAEISAEARQVLRDLGTALSSSDLRGNVFEIQGHTCTLGNTEDNLSLSQRRAEAVKRYLGRQFGLDPDQLLARGFGESKPVADNDTEAGREQNRRVTVVNTMRSYAGAVARPAVQVQAAFRRGQLERSMTPGMVLRDDDDYAVTFKAAQTCYVYVYQKDSRGKWQQLFPSSPESVEVSSLRNPVQPGTVYRLPESEKRWLCLDETKGTEHLVVVAYPTEVPRPVQVCQAVLSGHLDYHVAEAPTAPIPGDEGITTMGVKGTRAGYQTAPRKSSPAVARVKDVEGNKLFQWQLSFDHR